MSELEPPTYASTNYLEWLHPGLEEEKMRRQEEIARRMSEMLVRTYWEQLHERRMQWQSSLEPTLEDYKEEF